MLHTCVFSCSKRFLTKIFRQDVMNTNLRFLRSSCVNLDNHRITGCPWRCTGYASHSNNLHPFHNTGHVGQISRFYRYMHSNTDLTEHSTGTVEPHTYAVDSDADKGTRQSTRQVFNIDVLVSLLRQENATDICVIKVPKEMKYTDYFVVVSGSSSRHLRAMAHYAVKVYKYLKEDRDPHVQIEGKDTDDWLCIDFGDMVVHFMLPPTRETYELEKLWALRSFDEQLSHIPPETLPMDFIYDAELTK